MSEKDDLEHSRFLRESAGAYLSAHFDSDATDSDMDRSAADLLFYTKGSVMDGSFERRRMLVEETDSTTVVMAESLKLTKFLLSRLYVQGPDEDVVSYRSEVDSLMKLANDQEVDLARRSASFRRHRDQRDVSSERIAGQLPENAVLIEYVKYKYQQLDPETAKPHYLVLVMAGDAEPVVIDLGEASEVDQLVDQYRKHLLSVSTSGRIPTIVDLEDYGRISQALYEKIWNPIEDHLSDDELLLVAPDGGLNMLSFSGLIDDEGKYLIEKYVIHYLSSGRDLIRLADIPAPKTGLLALGDPNYDAPVTARLSETKTLGDTTAKPMYYATTRNIRSGCGKLQELTVGRLPGTRTEVEQIAADWKESCTESVITFFGSDASEERFKAKAPGNRIIHLATHGYFLQGACQPDIPRVGYDLDIGFIGENPLLQSGLFFAGANLHGEGSDIEGAEDGILTAYEVSAMKLGGTQLVVLSACETGLGKVEEGEGVYGLRRAFQMAGARTVVSALWPVSDQSTAEMMSRLYAGGKMSLAERMRLIQLEKIAELRKNNKSDHPYSWGGLVALGDWKW